MKRYRLHDEVKYRSEPFGCTIIRVDLQETRFYNEAGARLISLFRQARTLADASGALAASTEEERMPDFRRGVGACRCHRSLRG